MSEPARLGAERREALETPINRVFFSAVSSVELMIKCSPGKLEVAFDPDVVAEQSGFELLAFAGEDARPLRELPFHHRDIFDRMLIAQAIHRGYRIMTCDRKFEAYPVSLV